MTDTPLTATETKLISSMPGSVRLFTAVDTDEDWDAMRTLVGRGLFVISRQYIGQKVSEIRLTEAGATVRAGLS